MLAEDPALIDLTGLNAMCANSDFEMARRSLKKPRGWRPGFCAESAEALRARIAATWNEPVPSRGLSSLLRSQEDPEVSARQATIETEIVWAGVMVAGWLVIAILIAVLRAIGRIVLRLFGLTALRVLDPSEVSLSVRSGTVTAVKVWSETHVSSSGTYDMSSGTPGYANYRPGGYRVTNVSSTVLNRVQFFLAFDDGSEDSFTQDAALFPVREGHRISIVWGTSPWLQGTGPLIVMFYNHGIKKERAVPLGKIRGDKTKLLSTIGALFFLAMLASWFMYMVSDFEDAWRGIFAWTATLALAVFVLRAWQFVIKQMRADTAIWDRARALAEAEAENPAPVAAPARA